MDGVKPTSPINKIHERPEFSTLRHLQLQLVNGLHKVGKSKLPLEGHVGYILLKYDFALFSSKEWKYPEEVGEYYKIPAIAITKTEQKTEENKWKVKKDKIEAFKNLKMVLTKMFDEVVNPVFHYGRRGLASKGFGTTPPVEILVNLQRLYVKLSYQ